MERGCHKGRSLWGKRGAAGSPPRPACARRRRHPGLCPEGRPAPRGRPHCHGLRGPQGRHGPCSSTSARPCCAHGHLRTPVPSCRRGKGLRQGVASSSLSAPPCPERGGTLLLMLPTRFILTKTRPHPSPPPPPPRPARVAGHRAPDTDPWCPAVTPTGGTGGSEGSRRHAHLSEARQGLLGAAASSRQSPRTVPNTARVPAQTAEEGGQRGGNSW